MKLKSKGRIYDAAIIAVVDRQLRFTNKPAPHGYVTFLTPEHSELALDRIAAFFRNTPDGVFDLTGVEGVIERYTNMLALAAAAQGTNEIHKYEYECTKLWQELSYEFSKL